MKKVLIILAIVIVLVLGAVVGIIALGVSQIDNIVKAAIERGGTYATQADTTVTSVDVAAPASVSSTVHTAPMGSPVSVQVSPPLRESAIGVSGP